MTIKIAFLSIDNPKDFRSWSGLKLKMFNLLKNTKNKVDIIGPLKNYYRLPYIFLRETFNIFGYKYDADRNILLSKSYAKKIKKILNKENYDLIFTSDTYLVSFLDTDIPIILWTDVTFKTYYDHYFKKKIKINKLSFNKANYLEKLALNKARKIIVTSKWSKKETIRNYSISKNKISIIPFGSNLNLIKRDVKFKNLKKCYKKKCQLLSVGVDWDRKGMDKSIAIAKYMNSKGLDTNLTIIGAQNKIKDYKFVKQLGFINKNKLSEHKKLVECYKKTDFHILMVKSEACGVVFAEANSFGIYNISQDVGGVSGMIKNNINGKLFKKFVSVSKVGNYIINLFKSKQRYLEKRKQSYNYYKKNLSWNVNKLKINKIILNLKLND